MSEPAVELPVEGADDAPKEGGVTGKGFKPGVSGNPGGRPKGLAKTVREVLGRAAGPDEDPSIILVRFWAGVLADQTAKMDHRLTAADRLADRGWGKPPQFAPVEEEDPLGMAEEAANEAAEALDKRIDEVGRKRAEKAGAIAAAEAADA